MTRRRPARWRALLPRPPRHRNERIAAGIAALFGFLIVLQLARAALGALLRAWYVLPALAAAAAAVTVLLWARRRAADRARALRLKDLRLTLTELDALDPLAFELAVRDLMIRDGITARHVGQRGDQAADAVGKDPAGRMFVAQCKHITVAGRVASHTMYEVKGTAGPVHGADIAFVVTNGGFTRDAKTWGETNHIHWLDRDKLRLWAEHGTSLHELLHIPARARTRMRRQPQAGGA
ncbi:restriction endonuclease [Streptomyces sp. H10-C2]|uniref:restriction endonuclease n=1 Tax=unclassified Streptomyces TaxID=2593676 RepID=UPI0024B8C6D7|nr:MULTISPECIES: restriction endonuclease [unclassified Streptomyces]MDJ0347431.1 restriction endonuclease [Streptomyces sp. PH10-H1]MDJ0374796.1 restriction endonuclease [Streptomyces sp. H10-C2]